MSIAKSFVSTKTLRKSQIEKIVEGTYLHRDCEAEGCCVWKGGLSVNTHSLLVVKREKKAGSQKLSVEWSDGRDAPQINFFHISLCSERNISLCVLLLYKTLSLCIINFFPLKWLNKIQYKIKIIINQNKFIFIFLLKSIMINMKDEIKTIKNLET